jgi:hypothetical protein
MVTVAADPVRPAVVTSTKPAIGMVDQWMVAVTTPALPPGMASDPMGGTSPSTSPPTPERSAKLLKELLVS